MDELLSYQTSLFEKDEAELALEHAKYHKRSGAFTDNMSLPVHRWFRYSAGFSADWVRSLVRDQKSEKKEFTVLDPFAGVATTLLACDAEQTRSIGFEAHPFVYRVARAKLSALTLDVSKLRSYFNEFLTEVLSAGEAEPDNEPPLLKKCYSDKALAYLVTMRTVFEERYASGSQESEMLWLIITAILRSCSTAGTAQWQYVLPNKKKLHVIDPVMAFRLKAGEALKDIYYAQQHKWTDLGKIVLTDARSPECETTFLADSVITSPPYPNNYDYADATRLEMTFWNEISNWGDLQGSVRKYLIRSCSQHAAAERLSLDDLLKDEILDPIRHELSEACYRLADVRLTRGGRKTYHTMAAAYFKDLGHTFRSLRSLCREGSTMCFVIGDSAPYGIYLDVDTWLGALAMAVGFKSYTFEKIRDRNLKWKNRKHTVPLKEGRLWIKG